MMSLLSLPDELLLEIASHVSRPRDVVQFLLVCRRTSRTLKDVPLEHNIKFGDSTALIWAVRLNRVDAVSRMIRLGANPQTKDMAGLRVGLSPENCLDCAVKDRNLKIVEILTGDDATRTAIKVGKASWQRMLLNSTNLAFLWKEDFIARALLNAMIKVNTPGFPLEFRDNEPKERSMLASACANKLVETVRLLLASGADPNWHQPGSNLTDFLSLDRHVHFRVEDDKGNGRAILELLISAGLDVDAELMRPHGTTPAGSPSAFVELHKKLFRRSDGK